jgi:outer membrane protein W
MKKLCPTIILVLFLVAVISPLAFAQHGKKSVGAGLELAIPMGDFGDAATMGFGGTAAFQYGFKPNIDLIGTVGYLHWGAKSEFKALDFSWSAIPIQVGGKYFFQPTESRFYVGGLVGFHIFSFKTETINPFTLETSSESTSETKIGLAPLGGYELKVGENMMLDIQARYQFVSDFSYFGLRVGLNMGLK